MVPREPPNQRAARVPLDYYRRPGVLDRWKLWLALAAAAVTVGWVAAGLLRHDGGEGRYARGPVAAVHAAWEDDCSACHVPFTPITANRWTVSFSPGPHAADARCRQCHQGPAHHARAAELACSSCHRDHQGRDASLVRLADGACTGCHADLERHRTGGGKGLEFANAVTSFTADGHPEFRPVRDSRDPGTIQFNHQRHMAIGLDMDLTVAKIPGARAGQFPTNRQGLVQLECGSCHEPDGGAGNNKAPDGLPAALAFPARTAGKYLRPVVYDKHCRACHPLAIEGGQTVRHGLQPGEVHAFLENHFLAQVLREDGKLLERPVPTRPLPGKLLEGSEKSTLRARVRDRVLTAEKALFGGRSACGECHSYETRAGVPVASPLGRLAEGRAPDLRIPPARIPQVWFRHAVFDHAAHHAVDCRSCHARAYAATPAGKPNPTASQSSKDVLVPGKDNCLQCHAPRTRSGGGARFDCTECHRYHDGDHSLRGPGDPDRDPATRRGVERFLKDLPARKEEPNSR